jgi:hypothetical protein
MTGDPKSHSIVYHLLDIFPNTIKLLQLYTNRYHYQQ